MNRPSCGVFRRSELLGRLASAALAAAMFLAASEARAQLTENRLTLEEERALADCIESYNNPEVQHGDRIYENPWALRLLPVAYEAGRAPEAQSAPRGPGLGGAVEVSTPTIAAGDLGLGLLASGSIRDDPHFREYGLKVS